MKTLGSRMSIIKNLAGLSFVAMALAASLPADARIAANTHETNRLAGNRLAGNRLAGNRLAGNALATNKLAGDGAFTDIVAIELPGGMRFTR
jgi:hypothetical protein